MAGICITRIGIFLRRAMAVAGLGALMACAPTFQDHGYIPEPQDLAALTPGVDTRETVAAAVGRPSTVGVIDDGAWYYVRERVRHAGWRTPRPIDRQLLAMSFGADGRLANIERFGLEDGRVVALSRRVTDTTIRDFGLLQQIFANFGRIDVGEQLAAGN